MTHKHKNNSTKFGGPRLPGAWDLCVPSTGADVLVLVSAQFLNTYLGILASSPQYYASYIMFMQVQ